MRTGLSLHADRRARFAFASALLAFVPLTALVFRDQVLGDFLLLLRAATAEGTAALLNWVGIDAMRQATAVVHPSGFGIEISRGCTGLVGFALLVIAIAAYPADRRARLVGILVCPLAFLLVNFGRLTHLFYLGIHHPTAFHLAHAVVWQGLMAIVAFSLWYGWASTVGGLPSGHLVAAFGGRLGK